jgi:hypothetical protein
VVIVVRGAWLLRVCGLARAMWYICAMILKHLAVFAVFVAISYGPMPAGAQTSAQPAASQGTQASPATAPAGATANTASGPAAKSDCQSGPCDYQPPHITIATPAPAPALWPLQERIAWGANILLALLGYAGIMMALSILRKIERQGKHVETAAQAAADSAQAALLHAQAILHAERPWVLVTVAPSPSIENGFTVMATNRGRSPARIVALAHETRIAVDEAHMPGIPEFKPDDEEVPPVSIILLPGEMTTIKSFCRDDVKGFCASEERLRKIENWEERIFLYGKVVYKDLLAPIQEAPHQTGWCCRYIHGRQKSGLVIAGTQEYNLHT